MQHISKKRRYPEGHIRFSLLNYYCSPLPRRQLVPGRIHKNQSQTDISDENQHNQRQQYKTNDAQFRLFTQIPKGQHDACHSQCRRSWNTDTRPPARAPERRYPEESFSGRTSGSSPRRLEILFRVADPPPKLYENIAGSQLWIDLCHGKAD